MFAGVFACACGGLKCDFTTRGFMRRAHASFTDGDGELIVRASAVLKSQGPENWSRGRPGLVRARTNSRSVRGGLCGKIRGKNRSQGSVVLLGIQPDARTVDRCWTPADLPWF